MTVFEKRRRKASRAAYNRRREARARQDVRKQLTERGVQGFTDFFSQVRAHIEGRRMAVLAEREEREKTRPPATEPSSCIRQVREPGGPGVNRKTRREAQRLKAVPVLMQGAE